MTRAKGCTGTVLAVLAVSIMRAQAADPPRETVDSVRTFYFKNVATQNEGTELTTTLRNMLEGRDKVYYVASQNAVLVQGAPDQLLLAQKIISDLDRARRTYRLTYTVTEMDGGKRIGTQHFSMIVISGGRTTLKQGSKVPIVTGFYKPESTSENTQVTYLDIGLNVVAELDEAADGVQLKSKVEQSSVAEERSGLGATDPIVRQTVIESSATLTAGKPLMLGSLDVPGSTRHLDVEVSLEAVR